MRIGYFLSSEEFDPRELIRQARMAEDAGFHGLWISDHYHPWNDQQGHSGFVCPRSARSPKPRSR
jgi:alkanesulfonate monooxygenase SsuD/methylene tetrahydromethanopterin reductase-like flavin-dependent oxidoreductase (luciferase family)